MPEQRCTDLGASCICSEPLQALSYPESAPDFKNPDDSSTLQCSQDGVAGGAITRTADDVVAASDSAVLAALPAGHSVSRYCRAGNDHQGTFMVGQADPVSASFARVAARWYLFHSTDFEFSGDGACNNSKWMNNGDGGIVIDVASTGGGANLPFHTYGYINWPGPDCCVTGPGPNPTIPKDQVVGKWTFWEVAMSNRSGPDFRIEMWARNITDDGAEVKVIDLWDNPDVDNLTPPALMSDITSNNHRFSSTTGCLGWKGIMHYMYAGWTTDAGQRIGAASEVEGGAAPAAVNLRRMGGMTTMHRGGR